MQFMTHLANEAVWIKDCSPDKMEIGARGSTGEALDTAQRTLTNKPILPSDQASKEKPLSDNDATAQPAPAENGIRIPHFEELRASQVHSIAWYCTIFSILFGILQGVHTVRW